MSDEFDPWENIDILREAVETSLTIVSVINARAVRGELCDDDGAFWMRHTDRLRAWRKSWSPELQDATGLTEGMRRLEVVE